MPYRTSRRNLEIFIERREKVHYGHDKIMELVVKIRKRSGQ